MKTATKHNISKEAIAAYKRAIELHNAPLPADPEQRQIHQQNYYQATEALRVALDRSRARVEILDTLGSDKVPHFIFCRGSGFADDWLGAIAIRKALEQLVREEIINDWCDEDHSSAVI